MISQNSKSTSKVEIVWFIEEKIEFISIAKTFLNSIEKLFDSFKRPWMTSEVTEVNYLEVAEELSNYDVLLKKSSFH